MLTIQPNVTNSFKKATPAFGQREQYQRYQNDIQDADYVEFVDDEDDKVEYKQARTFWEEQKRGFEDAAEDMALPTPVRKGAKLFSIISTAAVEAVAVFYTGKQTLKGAQKLLATKPVQKFFTNSKAVTGAVKNGGEAVLGFVKNGLNRLKNVGLFKTVSEAIGKKWDAFTNLKFIKAVKNNAVVKAIGSFVDGAKTKVSAKATALSERVGKITADQYKNAIAGTLATGAGVAGAVDEADNYLNGERQLSLEAA